MSEQRHGPRFGVWSLNPGTWADFWLDGMDIRYEVLAGDASMIERRLFSTWDTNTNLPEPA